MFDLFACSICNSVVWPWQLSEMHANALMHSRHLTQEDRDDFKLAESVLLALSKTTQCVE